MAKKKSTMSLKDFHGGVIPTDLQLPSAPGMSVDRGTYERHQGWNNNRGYGGDRGRQAGANGFRAFEDKASYFVNNGPNIGRNFDEDERRPIDNRPHSSPANERSSMDFPVAHDKVLDSRVPDRHSRDIDNNKGHHWPGYQPPVGRWGGQGFVGAPVIPAERQLNAWGVRDQQREVEASTPWRVRNNVARIAEASAIDKVSSGRWQPGTGSSGLERTRSGEEEKLVSRNIQDDSRKVDTLQISHGLEEDDGRRAYEVHPSLWPAQTSVYSSGEMLNECPPAVQMEYGGSRGDGGRAPEGFRNYDHVEISDSFRRGDCRLDDRYRESGREEHHRGGYDRLEVHGDSGSQGRQNVRNPLPYFSAEDALYLERFPQEVLLEKFHPRGQQDWERSRAVHDNQQQLPPPSPPPPTTVQPLPSTTVQPPPSATVQPPPSTMTEAEKSRPRSRLQHDEAGSHPVSVDKEHAERPRLNLKPRSLPSEAKAGSQKERQTLFGGARPRELVLKERGVDEAIIAGLDTDNSDGSKSARADTRRQQVVPRNGNAKQELMRSESDRYDGRRDYVRQDQPQEVKRDIDRKDSWRRPADPTVSALAELPSRPLGKPYTGATSAVELAQAFSRLGSGTPSTRFNNNVNTNTNTSSSSNRQRGVNGGGAW